MKALLQRARDASVVVEGKEVGAVDRGLVVLVCAEPGDTDDTAAFLAHKIARMRIFADDEGRMNRSVIDVGGGVLAVSQFTLAADWRKGNRPGFSGAAPPELGRALYESFCRQLEAEGVPVATGVFGAHMELRFTNDGPVTIWMDSNER